MIAAGQPRALTLVNDPPDVTRLLQHGLDLVEDLSRKLQDLDTLLLTGRPHEISDAALVIETAIRDAGPAFQNIAATMHVIGAPTLAVPRAEAGRRGRAGRGAAAVAGEIRAEIHRREPAGAEFEPRAECGAADATVLWGAGDRTADCRGVEESKEAVTFLKKSNQKTFGH